VLASAAPARAPAAPGAAGCHVALTPQGATLPALSPLQIHTLVGCSGLRGVNASVGVALSIDQSRLLAPLDGARGAAAVFLGGNVTDGQSFDGPSRAYAQLEPAARAPLLDAPHAATVVWQPSAQMLYLFLDGVAEPVLFATLAPGDGDWLPAHTLIGFTAESAHELDIEVWDVRASAPAAHAPSSRLAAEPLRLLTACEPASVRIDPRDSCGFPILAPATAGWRVRVDRADGEEPAAGARVRELRALDDGTLALRFAVDEAGNYTVRGAPEAAAAAGEPLAPLGTVEVRPCTRPTAAGDDGARGARRRR
jgi:hypothetical protein